MSKQDTFLLTGECLQQIVRIVGINKIMDELIEKMYHSFINFKEDKSIMLTRSGFNYREPKEGLIEWMPIRDISKDKVTVKVVGYHPHNPIEQNLPTIISTISQYNTSTGHLQAIIDGVLTTSLRTGAASAIASKLMARQKSNVLGLIGCGAQAVTQLHALSRIFDFDSVIYFDIDTSVQNSFQSRTEVLGLNMMYAPSTIQEIVESSDILCTATSIPINEGPLFQYKNSKKWMHINAVGSDFPGKIELPKSLLEKSYVCPDFTEQAIVEGECQQLSPDQIGEDLITCLQNEKQFQSLKEDLTVFDSTGMALQDQIVAELFLDYAEQLQLGQYIHLENTKTDVQNPYSFIEQKKYINA